MKKLIIIILMLFVVTHAAENQKIIFSGNYLNNNLGTGEISEADSAWLFMYYYDALVGSTTVTAEDLQWDGYYQHTHQCTNDSADGWSGRWIYFDTYFNSTISMGECATVASARDSSVVGDTNNSLYQANATRAYVWSQALNPDGKWIDGSTVALPIALDNATGSFDKDDFEDDFFETMSDTNRIRNDSLFTLAVATIDSLNKVLDSIYLANYNATSDCAGVGNYTCTLYVTDTLNDWRVADVNVSINNQAEDAKPRVIQTNANGRIIVQYSNGDYRASCLNPMLRNNEGGAPFLDFTIADAPIYDSLMGYLQSVGSPVAAEACSVYGWLYDVKSQAVDGATIIFELVSDQDTLYYDNVTYLPSKTVTHSNSDGYWSICVIPNELLDTLSFYSVDIIRDHSRMPILQHSDVYVPDSTTVKFNDLLINFNRKGK